MEQQEPVVLAPNEIGVLGEEGPFSVGPWIGARSWGEYDNGYLDAAEVRMNGDCRPAVITAKVPRAWRHVFARKNFPAGCALEAARAEMLEGELGRLDRFRFIESPKEPEKPRRHGSRGPERSRNARRKW